MTSRNLAAALTLSATLWLTGCGEDATEPTATQVPGVRMEALTAVETAAFVAEIRQLAATSPA